MKVLMWEGLLFTVAIGESFLKQVALKSHVKDSWSFCRKIWQVGHRGGECYLDRRVNTSLEAESSEMI